MYIKYQYTSAKKIQVLLTYNNKYINYQLKIPIVNTFLYAIMCKNKQQGEKIYERTKLCFK